MLLLADPMPDSVELGYARQALEHGGLVVVPTDTVYGLAALASDRAAVERMYTIKGREFSQPTAVAFADLDQLHAMLSGLSVRAVWAVTSLLPGPWTLVIANPNAHLPWITGGAPGPIGVRVPVDAVELPPLAVTSANRSGRAPAQHVRDLEPELVQHLACAIDRGPLATTAPSTVLDLVAWEQGSGEVQVIRDDAGRAGAALALLAEAP